MLKPRDIYKQIKVLTTDVISSGLCEAENYPSMKKRPGYVTEIGITGVDNAVFLKSIPYVDMYQTLLEQRHFNMKMIDGALLTMQYRFVKDRLSAHRLSYFPAPNLEAFQNDPELYLHDGIYADILDRRIVPVPFRFDYDNDEKTYQPVEHPISHLTLGQYKNCRIPVSSALTPYQFLSFVLRNFYHVASLKYRLTVFRDKFEDSIFPNEQELLHINTPLYKS